MTERAEVQDNSRERQLIDLLRLAKRDGRTGNDAFDENDNQFELKSTTTESVGTGRDVGQAYLDQMRTRYLVVAKGVNTNFGFRIEEVVVLHPDDLEEWIVGVESRIGADGEIVERVIAAAGGILTETDVARLRYLGARGATLNNPKIPWRYLAKHGTHLSDPAVDLRRFVAERPL